MLRYFNHIITVLAIISLLWCCSAKEQKQPSLRDLSRQGQIAYKNGDYQTFLHSMQQINKQIPQHPGTRYNIACGFALTGQIDSAFSILQRFADQGLYFNTAADSDLAALWNHPDNQSLQNKMNLHLQAVGKGITAFEINEPDLFPEGIAFDAKSQSFFISSIHKRKVVRRDADGRVSDFITYKTLPLWSVFAMQVDPERRLLWLCTTALPQMTGFVDSLSGKSAVLAVNIDSGELVNRFQNDDTLHHNLSDLTLNERGEVYVVDAAAMQIMHITPEKGMQRLQLDASFRATQGIAYDSQSNHLFVSDYSLGIYRIDLDDGSCHLLAQNPKICSSGVDGLYFHNNALIAIQNGIRPHRVVKFDLNAPQTKIVNYQVLEANHRSFDEPTLGLIKDGDFYFIANSQWGRYDKSGKPLPIDQLKNPLILHTTL